MTAQVSDWPRALALLDEALALTVAEREPWLVRTAADMPLVMPLLRKLLAAHDRVEVHGLLATLPKLQSDTAHLAPYDDAGAPGQRVGPFELIEPLGHGGMGSVWRARYADGRLKRDVAVKLPATRGNPASLAILSERFARERDFLAQLEHPNIARLYDAGVSQSGQPFLAMEYVAGRVIDGYCDTQALAIPARLALFQQVLEAVAYAHQQLVLHRDLKPGNVLVDGQGQVRLLDFGIARLLPPPEQDGVAGPPDAPDSGPPANNLTEQAGAAFTLGHAAPEQITRGALSTATDVYALGVMLYQLLTGLSPYQPSRDSRGALEDAVLLATPSLASARDYAPEALIARQTSAKALRQALRGDLDTILAKALKKNPVERYPSVAALADDLRRQVARLPIGARPDSWGYGARLFIARHRLAVAATALAACALVATTGVAAWQARVSAANALIASNEAARANAAQKFFAGLLSNADPQKNRELTAADRQMVDHALPIAERELSSSPETHALVLRQLSELYTRLDIPDKFLEVQQRRVQLLRSMGPSHKDDLVDAHIELARAMTSSPNEADRQQSMIAAVRARDLALANRAPAALVVSALCLLADLQFNLSQTALALASAQSAVQHARQAKPVPQDALALAYAQLGKALSSEGRFDEGRQALRQSVEIDKGPEGRGLVEQIHTRTQLAFLESAAGHYEAARSEALSTIQAAKDGLGEMEGTLGPLRSLVVTSSASIGDAASFRPMAQQLLASDLAAAQPLRRAIAHYSLGLLAMMAGQLQEAEASFRDAAQGAAMRPRLAAYLQIRQADLKLRQGHAAEALAMLSDQADAASSAAPGVGDPVPTEEQSMAMERVGVALVRLQRPIEAQRAFEQACSARRMRLPEGHPTKVRCMSYRDLAAKQPISQRNLQGQIAALDHAGVGRTALAASLRQAALSWAAARATSDPQFALFPLLD